jgi:hypothetical protein
MAGLGLAIYVFPSRVKEKTWMAGTEPVMTI